jgi:hypothetical protein
MTTATPKRRSASAELAKLIRKQEESREKLSAIKRKRNDFEAETEAMRAAYGSHRLEHPEQYEGGERRPKPGSEAAKIGEEIRRRMEEDNPFEHDYGVALAAFHSADEALVSFRRTHLLDLFDDLDPGFHEAEAAIRTGLESLLAGSEKYAALVEEVLALVVAAPIVSGKDVTLDPRPGQWAQLAREALDGGINKPGITIRAARQLKGELEDYE